MNKRNNQNTLAQNNPCLKEHKLSLKCLNDKNYDHEKCELYFANYNTCKEFWSHVKSDRKAKGIYPILPDLSERERIKEEFLKKQKEILNKQK